VQDKLDGSKMNGTDWRQEVVWVCGPRLETDTRESWFARGAKKAGVQWRQLKALFHREVTDPKYSIGERVKIAAAEARKEAIAHAAQIESLVSRMQHTDADFYREDVAAHLHALRQLRHMGLPEKEG
jgi:exoribonuclease II